MQSHDISALLWTYSLPSHIHHCQLLYRHVHEASPPAFSSSKLAGSINPHPVDSKRKAHLWLTWSPCALFWVNLELSFQFLKVRGYTSLVKKACFYIAASWSSDLGSPMDTGLNVSLFHCWKWTYSHPGSPVFWSLEYVIMWWVFQSINTTDALVEGFEDFSPPTSKRTKYLHISLFWSFPKPHVPLSRSYPSLQDFLQDRLSKMGVFYLAPRWSMQLSSFSSCLYICIFPDGI